MVRIRLSRKGKKKMPTYRIVVADVKFKRDGRFIENIGHYNPHTNPSTVVIKEDRALHWLSVGAQPSDAVKRFLEARGTLDRLKRFHAGESIEALSAEYNGTPVEAAAEVAEEVEETVEEVAEEAAEEIEENVAEAEVEEAEAEEPAEEDNSEEEVSSGEDDASDEEGAE